MDRLDNTDLKILKLLQENGRLTNKELASRVHLSVTPVYERLRRLENEGYIKKYVALLDADKLNRGFVVCYNISGSYDYMLKIHAPDMRYYQEFTLNVLGSMTNLDSIESVFVMSLIKQTFAIPVDIE